MRAAVLTGIRAMEMQEVPEPDPGPDDLKLRVHATGICGSDIAEYMGLFDEIAREFSEAEIGPFTPIMGHEISGEVVATGERVRDFTVGDRVAINPGGAPCGECAICRGGRTDD